MSMASPDQPSEGELGLRRALRVIAPALAVLGGVAFFAAPECVAGNWVTCHFFAVHDNFMLMLLSAALFALSFMSAAVSCPFPTARRRFLWLALVCVAVFLCGVLGRNLLFNGFDLSRDEVMAVFDADVFRSGRLFSSLPAQWRDFQSALQPLFMAPIAGGEHVISAYLPVNAALRALFSLLADPRFLNPLLAAGAVAMVYNLARQLWPQRPDAALVGSLLLATSSQLLVTSMTSYAMTAHLIFNMLWLRCFLKGGKVGHAGALMLGFLACGLHQVVFHPLFAAPFILRLLMAKSRTLGLFYALSYLLMIVFWGSYLHLAVLWNGRIPPIEGGPGNVGLSYLVARLLDLLKEFQLAGALHIALNLLRFLTWQNPLLLPLALLAWRAIRECEGAMRELAAGIVLTLLAMFVLLPYQGLGWGYRYWHGLLGSFCLLGACGWVRAIQPLTHSSTRSHLGALALASGFSIAIFLPLHARHVQATIAPTLAARRAILTAQVDIVLVDENGLRLGIDLVRNDVDLPDQRGHPLTLDLVSLTEGQLENLCAHYRLALFGHELGPRFGLAGGDEPFPEKSARQRRKLAALDCAPLMQ